MMMTEINLLEKGYTKIASLGVEKGDTPSPVASLGVEKGNTPSVDGRSSNPGRPKNGTNFKTLKWNVCMYDKETQQLKQAKFSSITELNNVWGLKLNSDYVKRIMTHYRADENMRNKENSFLARWGHIKIEKINELREQKKIEIN